MTAPRFSGWRALRLERGLSLRDLERQTGIHRGRLSVIERGLAPTPQEALRITAVLIPAGDQGRTDADGLA